MTIIFDPAMYSLKAIKYAAFDLSSKANVHVELDIDGRIVVRIESNEGGQEKIRALEKEVQHCVFDHQIRIEIGNEFKLIREMIIAQAFAPCDNLEEVIQKVTDDASDE